MAIRPDRVLGSGEQLRALLGLPPGAPAQVTGVTLDSRSVLPGDLYAALPGFTTHGARFAAQAAAAGAAAILTDPQGAGIVAAGPVDLPLLVVDDPRAVLGEVAAWLYGRPAQRLSMVGITGTNGKTTTSYLLDGALRADGRSTGVIGTVAAQVGDRVFPAVRTTPEAPDVHALLAVMGQHGAGDVTMEVSSHALSLGRVDGIVFDLAVFTNLSQDHLDFHGDMQQYFAAKAALFTGARARAALVCTDDGWGRALADLARAAGLATTSYGLTGPADWVAGDLRAGARGVQAFTASGPGGLQVEASVALPGRFNVANALAALAAAVQRGVAPEVAARGIGDCPGVPGRMERVADDGGRLLLVDYAHTPEAVRRALVAAREVTSGRVVCVLGCGGDRDRAKRPIMGKVAAEHSDVLVITDDNPRSESPAAIRAAIMAGVREVAPGSGSAVDEVGDRHRAIRAAVARAGPGDTVIVLGKGHEQGQEVAGVVHPFDDRAELRAALEEQP